MSVRLSGLRSYTFSPHFILSAPWLSGWAGASVNASSPLRFPQAATFSDPHQGLLESIFISRIAKRFSNIMLLRPGH